MLRGLGHEVTLYGAEGSDESVADHFVQCVRASTLAYCYGGHDRRRYQFKFDMNDHAWHEFQLAANAALRERIEGGEDFEPVLCTFGLAHQPCLHDLPANAAGIESGIGYRGTFAAYRVFESYAWMHTVCALQTTPGACPVGRNYDCVIPNYVDPAMFSYSADKGDVFLYMGRLNWDKGLEIALATRKEIDASLLLVGQLPQPPEDKKVLARIREMGGRYQPAVGPTARSYLLARARAVFAPTIYTEPFGGIAVEAQLSGTPVITTDYGAFSETVLHGVTGYRCHTLDQFVWAARHVADLDPWTCRQWALRNYSLDHIAPSYDEFLRMVRDVHTGTGWAEVHDDRSPLDWLRRDYPPYPPPPQPPSNTVSAPVKQPSQEPPVHVPA